MLYEVITEKLHLVAVLVQALAEIALLPQQADADRRHAQVAGGLEEVAGQNAEHAGVKVNAIRQSDEAFDYGSAQWDLIVYTYEPLPVTSARNNFV